MKHHLKVDEKISLRLLDPGDKDVLFELVDDNRDYLKEWLPWLDHNTTSNDSLEFIKSTIQQFDDNLGPQFVIISDGEVSGLAGFHPFDLANKCAEIGYWLSENKQGQGIITKCCKVLISEAFETYSMQRLQIPAAENNLKSRSVPERLGLKFEGILRNRQNLYGKFINHAMYSMTKDEYLGWHHKKSFKSEV